MSSSSSAPSSISDHDRFLFDLNGFLVVRGALSTAEVASLNAGIDANINLAVERVGDELRNTKSDTPLAGDGQSGRIDLAGMLGWEQPHATPWRNLLAHPNLVPYIHEFVGKGYRLDHQPFAILQNKGSEGFSLHGGPLTAAGRFNPSLQYVCKQGSMWNSLVAMSVVLADQNEGDGGFVVVRGSHKVNFSVPSDMMHGKAMNEHVYQPPTKAGDVVFFSEATVHGSRPWTADHQRRIGLYRFSPAEIAYGRSYFPTWPQSFLDGATKQQLAVLNPPFNNRLDRQQIGDDGDIVVQSRSDAKKAFDQAVFRTDYF